MDDQITLAQHQEPIDHNFHEVKLEKRTTKTKRSIGIITQFYLGYLRC